MIFTAVLSGIAEAALKAASAIFCSVYGIMRRPARMTHLKKYLPAGTK